MTFKTLLAVKGDFVTVHLEENEFACPCRTAEGYRDPVFHKNNPEVVECNDAGFIVSFNEVTFKAFMIPANGRGSASYVDAMFGEVQVDDYLGVFPVGEIDYRIWSQATESYVSYGTNQYAVIGAILIPDPHDTAAMHHYEVALRKINPDRPGNGVL